MVILEVPVILIYFHVMGTFDMVLLVAALFQRRDTVVKRQPAVAGLRLFLFLSALRDHSNNRHKAADSDTVDKNLHSI